MKCEYAGKKCYVRGDDQFWLKVIKGFISRVSFAINFFNSAKAIFSSKS
jgi:hypothetical protein